MTLLNFFLHHADLYYPILTTSNLTFDAKNGNILVHICHTIFEKFTLREKLLPCRLSLHWYVPSHRYYNLYFEKVLWYTKLQKYSNTEWIQIRVMSSHAQSILCVPILVFWFITLARTGKKYNVNMSCINAFIFITFQSSRTACPPHCFLL